MTLIEIASLFGERKASLVELSGLDKDALHIYFGLSLFLIIRLFWRWRGGWLVAWLAVLVMAIGGEWLDMTREMGDATIQPDAAHWHDIWNTIFWPTVLLLVGRWLQPRTKDAAVMASEMSGEDTERRLEQA
ncbi:MULTISPECIES: hypothetical protein [unclassified Sphingopyxis]|uniref:hypothetical protein n=1 Tax=unclassified Sphingopyxis TaxID=2614943 RepID=UPI000DC615EF|nr:MULTISPECIES: hypothetical protein [unclassified Sphingopyxis]BBB07406.1 hypothetical protein SPYCW_0422 [Sphingopyxis sp. EG6]